MDLQEVIDAVDFMSIIDLEQSSNLFESGAKIITSWYGVVVIVLLILTWAIKNWLAFSRSMKPCIQDMQAAIDLFNKIGADEENSTKEEVFAEYFDEFNEGIKGIGILRHPWSEFTETLIRDEEQNVISNTHSVSSYFTRDALLGDRVDLRLYSAFPNFLTGAGILGTFVGLVAGIYLASDSLLAVSVNDARNPRLFAASRTMAINECAAPRPTVVIG